MILIAAGLRGVAIPAQIRHYHREMVGQNWGDFVPHNMGLRVTMQQKQRRPLASGADMNFSTV
jgi:hypothetical protein